MKHSKLIIGFSMILLFSSCTMDQQERQYPVDKSEISAYNLINPSEVQELLDTNHEDYILLQVSKKVNFEKEHLVDALNVWRPDYGSKLVEPYGGLMGSSAELELMLQRLGFHEGQTLLLYDLKANVDALRLGWVLSYYGFENYKIINGGLKYCKASGMNTESGESKVVDRSDFNFKASLNKSMSADFSEVRASIQDTNTLLIDTREDYEYLGQPFIKDGIVYSFKKGAFNRGSIPGAIHMNWSTLADLSGDHRIKAEKNLRFDLSERGISPDKNIILYCQSGSRTSHTYYVLKHVLDYPNVKNYDGSWIEWSYKNSIDSLVPIQQLTSQEQHDRLFHNLELALKN